MVENKKQVDSVTFAQCKQDPELSGHMHEQPLVNKQCKPFSYGEEIVQSVSYTTPQTNMTEREKKAIEMVKAYMTIAYSPRLCKGGQSVEHLCAKQNKFIAPTTFPGVNTLQEYADAHHHIMQSLTDLHITNYDVIFAKEGRVCLRYSAEGTHIGEPFVHPQDKSIVIQPNKKHAKWTAAALFEVDEDNRIKVFVKDWDKYTMFHALGWPM